MVDGSLIHAPKRFQISVIVYRPIWYYQSTGIKLIGPSSAYSVYCFLFVLRENQHGRAVLAVPG